ncbi:MAG: glutamate synthase subunit alpha, partial [Chloroflexota bacterium]
MRLPRPTDLAVGMLFLPRDAVARERCQQIVEQVAAQNALRLLAWRDVPIDPSVLGAQALATQPVVRQALLGRPDGLSDAAFERTLYLARKQIERQVADAGIPDFYAPSFSHQTVVYKGLFVAPQLAAFYKDLRDKSFAVSLAVFHQRYSTNTFPNWYLAQPFRFVGHNGEINTLQGNRNWIRAREPQMQSQVWKERVADLRPLIQPGGSDSANLDNALEALVMSDRDILHAMTMMVPEAWENMPNLDPAWHAFYEYHACISEPWDGPAALAFSDGVVVGACLDRNGLRPARYKVADDGIVSMASEVGVIDMDDRHVIRKGRLGPGEMI